MNFFLRFLVKVGLIPKQTVKPWEGETMDFQRAKFKEAILYICSKANPECLGAIKLNKVLWYSDVYSYWKFGQSITGAKYFKLEFGPAPKAMLPIQDEMIRDGDIEIKTGNYQGMNKTEYKCLRDPRMSSFSEEEIEILDCYIGEICYSHTATSISNKSHDRIYNLAKMQEEIPYCATLASVLGDITGDDILWAKEKIAGIQ